MQFLGTGAAEGIPAMYCHCEACTEAREKGGPTIRKRSALLINDELCIDFGPDIQTAFEEIGYDASKLKYLVITHSHFDHLYPENLEVRGRRYIKETPEDLEIMGSKQVFDVIDRLGCNDEQLHIVRNEIQAYETIQMGQYEITAIPARHALDIRGAYNYVISDGKTRLLYATDTGIYEEEVFDFLEGIRMDCVILDATNVFSTTSRNHLNEEGIRIMLERMQKDGVIDLGTKLYATHFSHTGYKGFDEISVITERYHMEGSIDHIIKWIPFS